MGGGNFDRGSPVPSGALWAAAVSTPAAVKWHSAVRGSGDTEYHNSLLLKFSFNSPFTQLWLTCFI